MTGLKSLRDMENVTLTFKDKNNTLYLLLS